MTITLHAPSLKGEVKAIASKSEVHRLLICASLANTDTSIACSKINADIEATQKCLSALGADITYENGYFHVKPICRVPEEEITLLPGESGSTLRFLLPIVCGLGIKCRFIMEGRLSNRPLSPLKEVLEQNGAVITQEGNILYVSGKVHGGTFSIAGDVSSQFISGLLFMLSACGGTVTVTGQIQSLPYIEMTTAALSEFGCNVVKTKDGYEVPVTAPLLSPKTIDAKGDWSNAAFFITAGVIGKYPVKITDIDINSKQGDKAIINVLREAGAKIDIEENTVTAWPSTVFGTRIDASQIPDLVPILSIAAAVAVGQTVIYAAGRLRIKESDRLAAVCHMLTGFGADCQETEDGLIINGTGKTVCNAGCCRMVCGNLTGGPDEVVRISSHNDHRIAMSAAIAATCCLKKTEISGAEAVNKSYPLFWEDYHTLTNKEEEK